MGARVPFEAGQLLPVLLEHVLEVERPGHERLPAVGADHWVLLPLRLVTDLVPERKGFKVKKCTKKLN
jgi:hypothetical protein